MNISALLQQMLVLFGIILVGYALARKNILTQDMNRNLSTLVAMLTNPLQVLATVLSGSHPLENRQVLALLGLAFGMFAVLIALSVLLPRVLRAQTASDAGLFRYLFLFSNLAYMGYPVIEALLGKEYTFYATIFVMVFQLVCWSYGVSVISGQKMHLSWEIFKRPTIVTALLAIILYFVDLRLLYAAAPRAMEVLYSITDGIGGLTSPLAMLIIGGSLAGQQLREVFNKWRIYALCAIKLLVLPIAAWLLLHRVISDSAILGVLIVMLAMPAATNATIMSYEFGGDVNLASAGVFMTTLLSIVTIPAVMYLLFSVLSA